MKIIKSVPVALYFADCDTEIEVWANVTYFYPGAPGNYYGKPEDCYPEEYPEVDYYLSWKEDGPYSIFLNEWIMEELYITGWNEDGIMEQLIEEMNEDYYEI